MPSPRPMKPMPSFVVAFTFTRPDRAPARRPGAAPSRSRSASFGRSRDHGHVDVHDAPPRAPPHAGDAAQQLDAVGARASAGRRRESARRCRRARPRRAARRSPRAASTSASEWPSRPRSPGISTPPRTSGRPPAKRCGRSRCRSGAALIRAAPPALAALEHAQPSHARVAQLARPPRRTDSRSARAHARPRTARRASRPPGTSRARSARVDLPHRLAQPGGRHLDRDVRGGDPLDRELVVGARGSRSGAGRSSPQTFTRSGCARMSNRPLAAASPSASK